MSGGLRRSTLLDQPLEATRDLVIFPIYFLAIGATSLRYDWRVSTITGLTAIVQYLGLAYYALWNWRLDHLLEPVAEAQFSAGSSSWRGRSCWPSPPVSPPW